MDFQYPKGWDFKGEEHVGVGILNFDWHALLYIISFTYTYMYIYICSQSYLKFGVLGMIYGFTYHISNIWMWTSKVFLLIPVNIL